MYAMIMALLIMTTYRTIHLVSSTITDEGMKWLAIFAVVAIDLGVLGWTYLYRSHAQGPQRIIALMMFVVDLLAVLAAQIGDTALQMHATAYNSTIESVSLFVIPVIIVVNIGAFALYEILDPENQVRARLLQGDYDDSIAIADLQDMYRDDLIANRKAAYERQAEQFVPQQAEEQMGHILRNARGDSERAISTVNAVNETPQWTGASRPDESIKDQLAQRLGYTRMPDPNGQRETSPKGYSDPIKAAEEQLKKAKADYEREYNAGAAQPVPSPEPPKR